MPHSERKWSDERLQWISKHVIEREGPASLHPHTLVLQNYFSDQYERIKETLPEEYPFDMTKIKMAQEMKDREARLFLDLQKDVREIARWNIEKRKLISSVIRKMTLKRRYGEKRKKEAIEKYVKILKHGRKGKVEMHSLLTQTYEEKDNRGTQTLVQKVYHWPRIIVNNKKMLVHPEALDLVPDMTTSKLTNMMTGW